MIYVFKTSVQTESDVLLLKPHLDSALDKIEWNFDLEDCDHILRADTPRENPEKIVEILKQSGFECQELDEY
ncbi:hypothetical protein [Pedobacter nanyangensis]|uniref:hypothetical protein n=1 Tax=Pedobacter nanyangensis TaxID=1562389 RepID=UPI000DE27604|nr:hypothetical protein [Pedobacter nanyangensis]